MTNPSYAESRGAEDSLTWDDALSKFEYMQRMQGHAERTIGNYLAALLRLQKTTGLSPAGITKTDLREALYSRGWSPSMKQTQRAIYQVFFRFLRNDNLIDSDPAATLEKIKVPRREPRPLTVSQVEALLTSGAYSRTRTMILLGALQGFRVSEIASVRGEMFDLVENTIRYVSKGGIPREAQMHPLVRAEAWKYPRRGYWFPSRRTNTTGHVRGKSVSDLIARAMDRAGIRSKKLTAHSLRHFFGTQLLDAGVDIRVIQHMMGHASLATTALYTQVSRPKEVIAIKMLPYLDVPSKTVRRGSRDEVLARTDDARF